MIDTTAARFSPPEVEAVVFDIGGVFLYPHYDEVRTMLREHGLSQPDDLTAFRRAHHAGCAALSRSAGPTREHDHDFWVAYDEAYADQLEVPGEHLDGFRVAVRGSWDWAHQANIAAFHRLAVSGMPVAIVSNNDGTAAQQMIDHGVCQLGPGPLPEVQALVDSGVVGVAKPDPAIMAPALDALDPPPDRVLYVGDTVHADVVGATRAGMQVTQLDPFHHHDEYGHPRLADLDALLRALGVE